MFVQLNSIDVSKACGPDLITGFLLKKDVEVLASPLSYLFTTSMCAAALPRDWVTANVVPIFKCDDKSVVKNYLPISLTSMHSIDREESNERKDKGITMVQSENCLWNNSFINLMQ